MIDIKSAVNTAIEYVKSLIPEAQQLQLEEVELTEDSGFWLITLSFQRPGSSGSALQQVLGKSREYKTVKLASDTGEPQSLKIRNLTNA